MKRYDEYKDLELPWLANPVPSHWSVKRHKNILAKHRDYIGKHGKAFQMLSLTLNGVIVRDLSTGKGKFSKDVDKYVVVSPGDFVFCLFDVDETPRTVGLSKHGGMITGAYDIFTPHDINSEFFYYYYLSLDNVKALKPLYTGLRKVIGYSAFMGMYLPAPPREEQEQIVRYLDWKISKINHLIHGYQKQIALLKEHRLTVINNAVTKGIHSEVSMQHIDSNWMGDIPAHWRVDKVKQHFHIKKEIAGKEGYDVISITQQGLKVKDISLNEGQMAQSYSKYQFVHPSEYAMNHMDLLTGYIGLSAFDGVTSPDYRVFVLDDIEGCNKHYYLYIFQLGYKRKIFYGLGRGAANKGRWRMPAINFKNFEIPVPTIEEQNEIVEWVSQKEAKFDLLISKVEKQIELLLEYRTRLISDVVTGQIDVRDEVIPDYTLEDDTDSNDETSEAEEREVSDNADKG